MTHSFFAALVGAIAIVLGGAPSSAQNAYITNSGSNTVSVIDTATNTVVSTIPVGSGPDAFGIFIRPAPILGPTFAGTPGSPNCQGKSVSALATKFGGLDAAAAALGFSDVQGLQNAIGAFCAG